MKHERNVAGILCSEVLDRLSAYLDGELPADDRQRVEQHVRDCELCTRFGGVFAATIHGLRSHLRAAEDLAPDVARRLEQALPRANGT